MKKVAVIGVTMVVLLAGNLVQAGVCEIVNGSFEDDDSINDITVQEPNGWDVSVPANKFQGYVSYKHWQTDGNYSLTLHSEWFNTFDVNDMAMVSQDVYLADVNQITFDVKLETYSHIEWDPSKCTAVLLIDDDVVWESSSEGADVRGEYVGQTYTVEDKYKDEGPHKLSLGLRVNVAEMLWERYVTHWDLVECTLYCEGGGFLAGDFNHDCYVDMSDLKLVADVWLNEIEPDGIYNLFRGDDLTGYGTINFSDFAIYAEDWDGNMADVGTFAENWLDEVEPDDQHNLFKDDDVVPSGIVNFFDFVVFAGNWLGSSYEGKSP